MKQHDPMHPGAFIKQVYIEQLKISSDELAHRLKISINQVSNLLSGKSDISPVLALALSRVLGRSPESWLIMQNNFDLWQACQSVDLSGYKPIKFDQ